MQNFIKQKHWSRIKIENLDGIMYIAIEGPTLGFDDILMNAIVL